MGMGSKLMGAGALAGGVWAMKNRGRVQQLLARFGGQAHELRGRVEDRFGGADGNGNGSESAREEAVSHDREPGVPPPTTEDYEGRDATSAQSFPASDPPSSW